MSDSYNSDGLFTDGPVDSDVSFFRDNDCLVYFGVHSGLTCFCCGSGEIWQPMQTAAPPLISCCLRCGKTQPTKEFDYSVDMDSCNREMDTV